MTGTVGTEIPCTVFRPITWSTKDTTQTIREVKGHNATYKSICPK